MEPHVDPGDRPPRPLLAAALALALGSAAGGMLAADANTWRAAACAMLGVVLVLHAHTRGRARSATWLVVLLACAAWRARAELDRPPDRSGWAAIVARTADADRAQLEPGDLVVEVPCGTIADGDRIEVLGGRAPKAPARGPIEGPASASPRPTRLVALTDEIVRLEAAEQTAERSLTAFLAGLRARLLARLATISDAEARGICAALVFGDLKQLDERTPDLFLRTGTFHVLAVSGLQIALAAALLVGPIAMALAFLVRLVTRTRARRVEESLRALLVALVVALSGAGPPVVRAGIAALLARLGPRIPHPQAARVEHGGAASEVRLARRVDATSLWALALIVECARHPLAALDLSVQLSYAATLGLIVGTGPIARLLRRPGGAWIASVDSLGRPRSMWWRAPCERAARILVTALAASVAAVLATLPFAWRGIGDWSPLGVLATPAIGLPALVLLLGGWLAALVPALVPELPLRLAARVLTATLEGFDALPATPAPLPERPFALVAAACALAFVALAARTRRARSIAARASAVCTAILLVPWTSAPRALEVHALDVGSGTATLVRAPGIGTWIFDAGSRDRAHVAREALGPLLRALDPGSIGIVLSHADRDHDGALPWIADRWPPAVHAGALPALLAERFPHTTRRFDVGAGRAGLPLLQGPCKGSALTLERGLDVEGNEGSRTLRIRAGGVEVVLCGDAESEGLLAWLRQERAGAAPLRLLLAPHHGSDTAHGGRMLERLQPAEVWISASEHPPFAAEVARRGIHLRITAEQGPLVLDLAPP